MPGNLNSLRSNGQSATIRSLKYLIGKKTYWQMQLQKFNYQARKQDTRKKIMLGGLFIKAGLDSFYPDDPAALYGLLLEAKSRLERDPNVREQWYKLGKELIKF